MSGVGWGISLGLTEALYPLGEMLKMTNLGRGNADDIHLIAWGELLHVFNLIKEVVVFNIDLKNERGIRQIPWHGVCWTV